jgi:tetratricopeptide (TPR) repeat protein
MKNMAWMAAWAGAGVLLASLAAGCDTPPSPPLTATLHRVTSVAVNPGDPDEVAKVSQFLQAYQNYEQSLQVLRAYYEKIGAYDQQTWTQNELKTLQRSRTWKFEGVEMPPKPEPQSLDNVMMAGLVEQVATTRKSFKTTQDALADFYLQRGDKFKSALVRNAESRQDPVRQYAYFANAEIPPSTLRPTDVISEADALFAQADKIHRSGKPLPLITDYDKQRKALGMFLKLVQEYPTSTKIALSAYYIGDIYKEYFKGEDIRAVNWFQRAWEWDPHVMEPARFQAAVVYDLRLMEPGKALPLYREVIKYEQFNQTNVAFAEDRIKQLTGTK